VLPKFQLPTFSVCVSAVTPLSQSYLRPVPRAGGWRHPKQGCGFLDGFYFGSPLSPDSCAASLLHHCCIITLPSSLVRWPCDSVTAQPNTYLLQQPAGH